MQVGNSREQKHQTGNVIRAVDFTDKGILADSRIIKHKCEISVWIIFLLHRWRVVWGNELQELLLDILHNRMINAVGRAGVSYNKYGFWIGSCEGYVQRWVKNVQYTTNELRREQLNYI